ncbi:transcription regulator protein [Pusillimonas sp. T7-7]|uniref:TetR/AcrR family transcriptional regulator n=1 Tax=Pusillimonas sp. (strain T7-7) TaxID=1007105 RepID=UPI0002085299|nr:TetR/AcrR family transcriptional regulator [Pusillimonas sp. T7-7]AEC19584.1 transcription regulator protein [Pusillimonas sp. T7-7]
MRTKSEARKDAIMNVALEIFREVGFDAASMSQIAARVGGSKATLYNYFSSKEELLLEAMLHSAGKHADDVLKLLQTEGDFVTQLHRFVTSLLKLINAPDTVEILRVAISVGGTTDIGRRFYENGTHQVWTTIANTLQEEIKKGTLRDVDTDMMAMHLRCLCEAEIIRNLLGSYHRMSAAEAQRKAECIVEIFLHAYGTKA